MVNQIQVDLNFSFSSSVHVSECHILYTVLFEMLKKCLAGDLVLVRFMFSSEVFLLFGLLG